MAAFGGLGNVKSQLAAGTKFTGKRPGSPLMAGPGGVAGGKAPSLLAPPPPLEPAPATQIEPQSNRKRLQGAAGLLLNPAGVGR